MAPKPTKKPSLTGSQSANFHEGTRSEYLAHYVFSSFGTCVPVPHPEDTGIDLHCTLTERVGQRIWPEAYYFVQVKSSDGPWEFHSKQSVEQFLKLPLPVFLCIVTKDELRLRVYRTINRLSVLRDAPESLQLFPGDVSGEGRRWHDETNKINLGHPILDFTMAQSVDESFAKKAKEILRDSVMEEVRQILMRQVGIAAFEVSSRDTNDPKTSGRSGTSIGRPSPGQMAKFMATLRPMLFWLQTTMIFGDVRGHWRLQLLEHHLTTDGAKGILRKRGPLYETMLTFLREQRKAGVREYAERSSHIETLDALFDDIVHALITEGLEHQEQTRGIRIDEDSKEEDLG